MRLLFALRGRASPLGCLTQSDEVHQQPHTHHLLLNRIPAVPDAHASRLILLRCVQACATPAVVSTGACGKVCADWRCGDSRIDFVLCDGPWIARRSSGRLLADDTRSGHNSCRNLSDANGSRGLRASILASHYQQEEPGNLRKTGRSGTWRPEVEQAARGEILGREEAVQRCAPVLQTTIPEWADGHAFFPSVAHYEDSVQLSPLHLPVSDNLFL